MRERSSAVRENECDAREKNTQLRALSVTPRLLLSYARLTMSKIEGNKQANIHAIFAIFFNKLYAVAVAGNIFFVTLAVFPKVTLVRGAASFLTLPSFSFPEFSSLVQATCIPVFFTLNADDADHDRYPC